MSLSQFFILPTRARQVLRRDSNPAGSSREAPTYHQLDNLKRDGSVPIQPAQSHYDDVLYNQLDPSARTPSSSCLPSPCSAPQPHTYAVQQQTYSQVNKRNSLPRMALFAAPRMAHRRSTEVAQSSYETMASARGSIPGMSRSTSPLGLIHIQSRQPLTTTALTSVCCAEIAIIHMTFLSWLWRLGVSTCCRTGQTLRHAQFPSPLWSNPNTELYASAPVDGAPLYVTKGTRVIVASSAHRPQSSTIPRIRTRQSSRPIWASSPMHRSSRSSTSSVFCLPESRTIIVRVSRDVGVCVMHFLLSNGMGSCASRRTVAIITAKAPARAGDVNVRAPEAVEASLVVSRSLEGVTPW